MKKSLFAVLLVLPLLAGCAGHWVMTLNNGDRIATVGKPKLKEGIFVFKDIEGKTRYESAGRVREIAPASMVEDKNKQFLPR